MRNLTGCPELDLMVLLEVQIEHTRRLQAILGRFAERLEVILND